MAIKNYFKIVGSGVEEENLKTYKRSWFGKIWLSFVAGLKNKKKKKSFSGFRYFCMPSIDITGDFWACIV